MDNRALRLRSRDTDSVIMQFPYYFYPHYKRKKIYLAELTMYKSPTERYDFGIT